MPSRVTAQTRATLPVNFVIVRAATLIRVPAVKDVVTNGGDALATRIPYPCRHRMIGPAWNAARAALLLGASLGGVREAVLLRKSSGP